MGGRKSMSEAKFTTAKSTAGMPYKQFFFDSDMGIHRKPSTRAFQNYRLRFSFRLHWFGSNSRTQKRKMKQKFCWIIQLSWWKSSQVWNYDNNLSDVKIKLFFNFIYYRYHLFCFSSRTLFIFLDFGFCLLMMDVRRWWWQWWVSLVTRLRQPRRM